MTENILVSVAWPYANSAIHVGNITGSYLPADIFARYQRLKGRRVLMVSGSDAHGTPVTVTPMPRADPCRCTRNTMLAFWAFRARLSYDLFTSTHRKPLQGFSIHLFSAGEERLPLHRAAVPVVLAPNLPSFPTGTSRAPATSAATRMRAVTSATTAATCWTPPN
jgi:methionyl-tRNA synthetase